MLVFCLDMGIFGEYMRNLYKNFFRLKNICFLILFLLILLLVSSIDLPVEYCLDGEIDDKLKAMNNSVHIHNPNIKISNNMANALSNVGVGAAVGAGMGAGAKILKTSSLPVTAKFGIIVAGGVSAGVITTGTSAMMSIINSKNKSPASSSSTDTNFPAKSIDDNMDIDYVMTLLNSQFILNIIIVYLVVSLLILYILDIAVKNNWEFSFLKRNMSTSMYKFYISAIKFSSKSNKAFLLLAWVLLFICCISSLLFSSFILNNIDIISSIIKHK